MALRAEAGYIEWKFYKNAPKRITTVDNAMTGGRQCGAARRESVGIAFEDVARLALRRACLVSRFHPFNLERILWLRKRRRQKRRRSQSRRRSPRSNLQARVEPRSARAPRHYRKQFL